jgi:multidrug efflux pump subunit AcrA (membrane-fusion protein)
MIKKIKSQIAQSSINQGLKALIIFSFVFLIWAIFLPIQSASIAEGVVVLDFNRKTIQHLEGGIIDQILVKEGQAVNQGDILIYLHDLKAKTEQQILMERLWMMQLQKERLKAEIKNEETLNLIKFFLEVGELSANDNEKLQEIVTNQLRLFSAKKNKKSGEIKVLERKLKSVETKYKLFKKESSLIGQLVAEDNLSILREIDLQKSIADIEEQLDIARLQIANYKNEDLTEIFKQIKECDMEIVGLFNQLEVSRDNLKRSAITAPVSGKVMNIKYHTIGAVIPSGGELMNIVPQYEELIVEAKIKPIDIDNVAIGLKAKVALSAYKGKKIPKINGEVINISPDIVINDQSKESYFLARIAISKKDLKKLKNKVELYPGMPAQVFIITGSRSLIAYMFTPISESSYKAFRDE